MALKPLICPPWLRKGDKIGVVSLSSVLDENRLLKGKSILENHFELEVILGKNVLNTYHNFAGTDNERMEDFQTLLNDPEIKAIVAGRGGYGSSRIVDEINWESFKKSPKWLVGFSDITIVHQKIQSIGLQSIHGPMMVTLSNDKVSSNSLKKALFGRHLRYQEKGNKKNRIGNTVGQIVGGNLCLLAHNIGSKSDLDFDGKILFLEEIGEYYYNLDRMMVQLKRAGKLSNLAGLVVGQFSRLKENNTPFGKTAYEIVQEHVNEFSYPVCYDFPIGHTTKNRAVRCGEVMLMEVSTDMVILESQKQSLA